MGLNVINSTYIITIQNPNFFVNNLTVLNMFIAVYKRRCVKKIACRDFP